MAQTSVQDLPYGSVVLPSIQEVKAAGGFVTPCSPKLTLSRLHTD